MYDLAQAMHAAVSAAGDHRVHGRAREFAQRPFEFVLNRVAVRLRLPSSERGAVVLDA
ncbi:hypothetical protein QFZ97_004445 [Paraburkholderia youngii]